MFVNYMIYERDSISMFDVKVRLYNEVLQGRLSGNECREWFENLFSSQTQC